MRAKVLAVVMLGALSAAAPSGAQTATVYQRAWTQWDLSNNSKPFVISSGPSGAELQLCSSVNDFTLPTVASPTPNGQWMLRFRAVVRVEQAGAPSSLSVSLDTYPLAATYYLYQDSVATLGPVVRPFLVAVEATSASPSAVLNDFCWTLQNASGEFAYVERVEVIHTYHNGIEQTSLQ